MAIKSTLASPSMTSLVNISGLRVRGRSCRPPTPSQTCPKTHKTTTVARQLRGKVLFYCLLCGKKKPIAEKTMQSHRKSDPCQKKRAGLASALASAKNTPPPVPQATR